jgi:hypothetical protein
MLQTEAGTLSGREARQKEVGVQRCCVYQRRKNSFRDVVSKAEITLIMFHYESRSGKSPKSTLNHVFGWT